MHQWGESTATFLQAKMIDLYMAPIKILWNMCLESIQDTDCEKIEKKILEDHKK